MIWSKLNSFQGTSIISHRNGKGKRDVFPTENEQTWIHLRMDLELKRKSHLNQTCKLGFKMLVSRFGLATNHGTLSFPTHSLKPTWRIIPGLVSGDRITPIYKPIWAIWKGNNPSEGLPNHGYFSYLLNGMIFQEQQVYPGFRMTCKGTANFSRHIVVGNPARPHV